MLSSTKLIETINEKNYGVSVHYHDPLFTVKDSISLRGKIKGVHTKNLFLKNKNGQFFLMSCEENNKIDLKKISKSLGLGNLSFANEKHLVRLLGIKPGSVSPFALLNDINHEVVFYFEKHLYDSDLINFHPLVNTSTVTIPTKKFIEFMIENKKKIHIFSSTENKIIKSYE